MPGIHETLGPEGVRARTVTMAHPPVQCANMAVPLVSMLMRIIVMAGEKTTFQYFTAIEHN